MTPEPPPHDNIRLAIYCIAILGGLSSCLGAFLLWKGYSGGDVMVNIASTSVAGLVGMLSMRQRQELPIPPKPNEPNPPNLPNEPNPPNVPAPVPAGPALVEVTNAPSNPLPVIETKTTPEPKTEP